MTFSDKANNIRSSLKKYNKNSIVEEEITRLSKPLKNDSIEMQRFPWLSFLLIEWLYQVKENSNARIASSKDVNKIINKMHGLQDAATNFKDDINLNLALRRMLLGQFWCQGNPVHHQFTIIRLYSLMIIKGKTPYFETTFKKLTNVELFDFFQFSVWLSLASVQQRGIVKYEQIINDFFPKYSVEYIVTMIKLISGGPNQITQVMQNIHTENISQERYFATPKLLEVPFFRFEDRISSLHSSLSCKGVAEFVLNIFKREDHGNFRKHFSRHFEEYVGKILRESKISYINEKDIEKIYIKNGLKGKVIDFLVSQNDSAIFIDAKAIEPPNKVMVTDDKKIISQRLKGSFAKGIEQSFECAKLLMGCRDTYLPEPNNRFVIVVTHQDFYFSNGISLKEHVSNDFFVNLTEKYGDVIPVENVHFCSVENFESIMLLCTQYDMDISKFLNYCSEMDSKPQTQKFETRQHLECFANTHISTDQSAKGTDYLSEKKFELFEALKSTIKCNKDFWSENGIKAAPLFIDKVKEIRHLMKVQ